MSARASSSPLGDRAFGALRELVAARLGIDLAPRVRGLLERRLRDRLAALALETFDAYVHHLRYDAAREREWEELEHLVTVHETYFFREAYQLRSLAKELFPALADAARATRRITIWCAGCSTGEEAFSVAMLAREAEALRGFDVHVLGTDVSRACVEHARRGVYAPSALRGADAARALRWLTRLPSGELAVADDLRATCRFSRQNLVSSHRLPLAGSVDAVLCRNVLLYLGDEARAAVIRTFWERLRPGGALLLGHAESLLNVSTDFELLPLEEDLVYRRPLGSSAVPPPRPSP